MKRYPKRGFTLIELVMTIVVTGIIAVPLSLMLFEQVEGTFLSEDIAVCNNLLRFQMEKVNNLGFSSITNTVISNFEGFDYDLTQTVSTISQVGNERLKQASVVLTRAGSAETVVSGSTYISNKIDYGIGGSY
ncbi:MAG: type II secretion system protein [Candidatus Omnitrophica bacterium]|nr:type II secretion system protein [Candidatus Omnitrophota bacterium]